MRKEENYFDKNVEELNLSSVEEISSSYGVLVIPQVFQLSDKDQYKIDQYIMNGGNVVLLSSGFDFDATRWSGTALDAKVLDFFKHYGIVISKGAVVELEDEYAGKIPVNMYQDAPYPAWIIPNKDLINEDAIVSKGARVLFFPWNLLDLRRRH